MGYYVHDLGEAGFCVWKKKHHFPLDNMRWEVRGRRVIYDKHFLMAGRRVPEGGHVCIPLLFNFFFPQRYFFFFF